MPLETTRERLGDGDDHLGGDAVVGIVVAGEPVVVVLGLALRPDGHAASRDRPDRAARNASPASGDAGVGDRHVEGVFRPVGLVERDRELLALGRELAGGRLRAGRDPGDLELRARSRGRPSSGKGGAGSGGVRHRAADLRFLAIERQLGLDMLDVNDRGCRSVWRGASGLANGRRVGAGGAPDGGLCAAAFGDDDATSRPAASCWMYLVIKIPGC